MGDDLKFIDFHQLQIENKKFVKDIDEKNKQLVQLKLQSGTTIQTLNKLKKELLEEQIKLQDYDKEGKVKTESLIKQQANIVKSTSAVAKITQKVKKLNTLKATQGKDVENAKEFVKKKNDNLFLLKTKKDVERQIEIAELEAKKAKKILKQFGDTNWMNQQQQM